MIGAEVLITVGFSRHDERAAFDRDVAAIQARARVDARRFVIVALRCAFWAVIGFAAISLIGPTGFVASVVFGAAALWYGGRALAEAYCSTIVPDDDEY